MPHYYLEFLFDEKTPRNLARRIRQDKKYVWDILHDVVVVLRVKLLFIPVIFVTAMTGPPDGRNRRTFLETLDLISGGFDKYKWRWSEADVEAYRNLSDKVETRVKRIRADGYVHVFWPITVLDLKEVKDELDRVRSAKLLSPDDEDDRELACEYEMKPILSWVEYNVGGFKSEWEAMDQEERIRFLVRRSNESLSYTVNRTHEVLMEVCKQVNTIFWFAFSYFD